MMIFSPTRLSPIRLSSIPAIALLAILSATALGQAPGAEPQMAEPQIADAPPVLAPTAPSQLPAKPAGVNYSAGEITVTADNSSLNQILSLISTQTGIKITGGVLDERVYGNYGPAAPSVVLAQLLDGTGVNMMLLQTPGTAPAELILSQRNGGPTPPNPNASRDEERDLMTNRRFGPNNNPFNNNLPPPQQQNPTPRPFQPPDNNNGSSTRSTPATTTTQQSPNGVKTPQQIYQELQQMRQQQQSTQK